jgi:hypothetical protein
MPLNPLAPVTDYQSMLNRIFWFTTASALVAVWMLRLHVPRLDESLSTIDVAMSLGGEKALPTPGGYLLPALAIGIATRVFRLHARVSDWLGIRECFDLEVIIGGLANKLAVDLEPIGKERLQKARHVLMRKAFYPFVSSSHPQIDPQLIHQALDAWSWFWVGVEATLLFTLTAFGLIAGGAYRIGFQTLSIVLALAALGLPALRSQCKRYAHAQVRAILAHPTRAAAVRAALEELAADGTGRRLAA